MSAQQAPEGTTQTAEPASGSSHKGKLNLSVLIGWVNLFIDSDPGRDNAQEVLETLISRHQEKINVAGLNRLLHDYTHYKNRGPTQLVSRNGVPILSFSRLAAHWVLKLPNPESDGPENSIFDSAGKTKVFEDDTFSSWICRIAIRLQEKSPETLQLLVISEKPKSGDLCRLIPFSLKTIASVARRLEETYFQPTWIFRCLVSFYWAGLFISGDDLERVFHLNSHFFAHPPPLRPPSLRTNATESGSGKNTYWGFHRAGPGNIDPISPPNFMILCWQREVKPYSSDFTVYVSEPQKSLPESEYALIGYMPPSGDNEQPRLLIRFRSCHSTSQYSASLEKFRAREPAGDSEPGNSDDCPRQEVLRCILCAFSILRSDTEIFMQDCYMEIHTVHMAIRERPSSSKVNYLLHLKDCIKASQSGIDHGAAALQSVVSWSRASESPSAPSMDLDPDIQRVIEDMLADMECLKIQLGELMSDVEENQDLLRRHFQVVQDQRLFRLSILAGIFLPLSFATSFFGMNIEGSAKEGMSGFSNWTKLMLQELPPETRNATEIITSALGTSQGFSFTWLTFGVTSACLLLTLPLSLTIGAIIRLLVGGAAISATYWRVLVALSILLLFGMTVVGLLFSSITWVAFSSVFIIVQLGILIRNWKKTKDRYFWLMTLLMSVLFFALGFLVAWIGFFMSVPWYLIIVRWVLMVRGKRLRAQRRISGESEVL